MNLRQWTTNSINLDQKIKEDKTEANKVVKVLGLVWDSENDSLSLAIDKLIEETKHLQNITKRKALSIASKLFDPLGFVEPITVKAKIMIQELWKLKIGWDDNLPEEQKIKWEKWISELCNLKPLSMQRPYLTDTFKETQLHIFCDSSKYAYGAVAYFRGTSANNTSTAFVMAKTKVAPVKIQTLPRLELSAALLGANMLKYLQEIPRFLSKTCKITLWSDSQIVLSWLTTKKQLQQYVCSRVEKINQITSSHTWKYCPTSENPADLLTRGLSTAQTQRELTTLASRSTLANKIRTRMANERTKLHRRRSRCYSEYHYIDSERRNQRYTQHFKHHPSGKIQFVEQSIKSHRPSHSCAQDMEKENH